MIFGLRFKYFISTMFCFKFLAILLMIIKNTKPHNFHSMRKPKNSLYNAFKRKHY
jgi:hypothetical protein